MSNNQMETFNLEQLLELSMDDITDLPPMGVPPTGHYNMTVTFDIKEIGDEGKQVPAATYIVDAINEVSDESELSEVAVGQSFTQFFHLTKKDGKINEFGLGSLKEALKPFVERMGTQNVGELIRVVKQIAITGTVKRRVNKKTEQTNFIVKDVVIL